jgi:hypothetical protein
MLERLAPADARRFVHSFLDTLTAAPAEQSLGAFSPRLAQEVALIDSLRTVRERFLALGHLDSLPVVGANVFSGGGTVRRDLAFEFHGARGLGLVQVLLIEEGGRRYIDALHITPLAEPLNVVNGFRRNLGVAQALVLCIAIAITLFTLGTAVVLARTRMPRRWGWALLALVGFGQFMLNWTTGETGARLFNVQLFGASIVRSGPVAPWVVSFSFPLGAILALRRRKKALAESANLAAPVPAPTEPTTPGSDAA